MLANPLEEQTNLQRNKTNSKERRKKPDDGKDERGGCCFWEGDEGLERRRRKRNRGERRKGSSLENLDGCVEKGLVVFGPLKVGLLPVQRVQCSRASDPLQ